MKILYRHIGLLLVLIAPLFSALLTQDLEVISPTGIPLYYAAQESGTFLPPSNQTITIRFIETSMGVLLVREHKRGGIVQMSRPTPHSRTSLVVFKSSSGNAPGNRIKKMNVILE